MRQQFDAADPFRIVQAYQIWSERQSDQEDVKPEVFAEQVAYVFFVRLLLVRVLEDKRIISPRLASDGGFLEWSNYITRHFEELDAIGILNENFSNILARKASNSYIERNSRGFALGQTAAKPAIKDVFPPSRTLALRILLQKLVKLVQFRF